MAAREDKQDVLMIDLFLVLYTLRMALGERGDWLAASQFAFSNNFTFYIMKV